MNLSDGDKSNNYPFKLDFTNSPPRFVNNYKPKDLKMRFSETLEYEITNL